MFRRLSIGFALAVALAAVCSTSEAQAQIFFRRARAANYSYQPQQRTYSQPSYSQPSHSQPSYSQPAPSYAGQTVHSGGQVIQQSAGGSDMLAHNNSYRARAGLPGQRENNALTMAAQAHAEYMARTGQFSHNAGGTPSSRAAQFGYHGPIRENIAYGQSSGAEAFGDWSRSSGHYQNMTSNSSSVGFGAARGADGRMYYVTLYGD